MRAVGRRARARSGTAPRSRRAGSRRSSRARPASSRRSRCSRARASSKPCAVIGRGLRVGQCRRPGRRRTCRARTPSRRPSSPAGSRRRTSLQRVRVPPPHRGRRRSSRRRPSGRSGSTRSAGSGVGPVIARIRLASSRCCSSACGIATLSRSTQSGCGSPAAAPKNRSSERIGATAVALLAGPGRVALARQHDRAREVVGERGGLAAVRADAAQRHGRDGRSASWRSRTAWRRGRAAQRVAVGRAVELHASCGDAGAGRRGVDRRGSASASVPAASVRPSSGGELRVGAHRDQLAAGRSPSW